MVQRSTKAPSSAQSDEEAPICGLIMPISAMLPDYDMQHWVEVREALEEAITGAGMKPQMVSDSADGDVITQRIVSNIFNNPVVVCDVSGLNANVMFELGLRLASRKATIIVTDNIGNLPFDTRIIEHIGYRRDLRLHDTRRFIADLEERIKRDYSKVDSGNYKPFLEAFTGVETQNFEISESSQLDEVISQLASIQRQMRQVTARSRASGFGEYFSGRVSDRSPVTINYRVSSTGANVLRMEKDISNMPEVSSVEFSGSHQGDELMVIVTFVSDPVKSVIDAVDRVIIANTRPLGSDS